MQITSGWIVQVRPTEEGGSTTPNTTLDQVLTLAFILSMLVLTNFKARRINMASPALLQKTQPTRMRAATRRNQIVAVAAELFASRGFSGTTTKEIAEGAGVSEAIIFRHFASKDQLYAA